MKKVDRIIQVLPELREFRQDFKFYGTPRLAKLTSRQLTMVVWKDVTNYHVSENIVYEG